MPLINESIRGAQAAVEQKFLFRKIGLPFDYASSPEEFPSKAFATAKEAKANLPNPQGLGGGYEASCRNHALLFDGYLLRVEAGIESPADEQILDRLIGGLIRLDTIAPKAFLVGGLAPDGRGFYALPRRENHAAWAFAAMRGLVTAAIAPESQEKFRSIVGKWMERLKRDKFRLHTVDGKPAPDGDLSPADADSGPFLLAFLLVAAKAGGQEADHAAYAAAAEENSRARLQPFPVASVPEAVPGLMWRQAALSIIAENDPEPERAALARGLLREYALIAARHVDAWRGWDRSLVDAPVALDWRKRPRVALEQSPLGFEPDASWARLDNEVCLETAFSAMYALLLAGDAVMAEPYAAGMEECLSAMPWDAIVRLSSFAPAVAVHARGVEMGLWDKTLYDSQRGEPASEMSFAAKYLEPDYDEENPAKAGHRGTPPGKKGREPQEQGGGKKRRRKRKR